MNLPFKPSDLQAEGETFSETLLRYAKKCVIPELERRYGPCRPGYELKAIKFGDNRIPYIEHKPDFSIWLTRDCDGTPRKAAFQLAHECLHALHPVAWEHSTVLEEGLAVKFSLEVIPDFKTGDFFYDIAHCYAMRLCHMVDDLEALICRYRKDNLNKGISDMRCSDLRYRVPQAKLLEFDELTGKIPVTTRFKHWYETLLASGKN